MNNQYLKYGIRFFVLLAIQVLVLNNIDISPYVNPFIYPVLILTLPFTTPAWALMLIGLAIGISVDAFEQTWGMHAAVGVLCGALRPIVLNIIKPKSNEPRDLPDIASQGFAWFAAFSAILVFSHHVFFFILSRGNLIDPLFLLLKMLISFVCSMLFILTFEMIFVRQVKSKY